MDGLVLKNIRYVIVFVIILLISGGIAVYRYSSSHEPVVDQDVFYQISTINALLKGVYDGDTTFEELRTKGNFGIGTFNGLDGEMIVVDGEFYQIKVDGLVYPINDSMQTPFAVVTFFESDEMILTDKELTHTQLMHYLDNVLPTKNIFYAITITGDFKSVKVRSVPRQSEPYPLLVEAIKNQSIFDLQTVEGTIVGFRTPEYMEGINVPGYHFHPWPWTGLF